MRPHPFAVMALICAAAIAHAGGESLTEAVHRGDLAAVKRLVAAGNDVNRADENGMTPLFRAAFDGNVAIAGYLIAHGSDVNAKLSIYAAALSADGVDIPDGQAVAYATPLLAAAYKGHLSLVELLVDAGADVNLETADEVTALEVAVNERHKKVIEYLIAHGADLDSVRLGDEVGSKALAGMLTADVPMRAECEWQKASAAPAIDAEGKRFPASGQTAPYTAATQASGGAAVDIPDDGTVRAGAPLRFLDNGDGTISDLNTGLMWEKKCGGGGGLHDYRRVYPWSASARADTIWGWLEAVNAERGSGFAGYDDWRIPNVKELQSIIDYGRFGPAVSREFAVDDCRRCNDLSVRECSCAASSMHWTGTTFADFVAHAVVVELGAGFIDDAVKSEKLFVRAVRGGRG